MKTIGFVLKPELDEVNANQLHFILKNIEELNLNLRYKYITKNFSNPIYFTGVQEAVEHFIDNYSKKTISKITYSNSSYEDDIDKSKVCFFTVKGEFPNFHISSIFQQDQLNQEEIEKIWKKLEEIYWELGGKGYLYAVVTEMEDFYEYAEEDNFPSAYYCGVIPFAWRLLMDGESYQDVYVKEKYKKAPFYKIEEIKDEHLFTQSYESIFDYMKPENLKRIKDIFVYLSKNPISEEERQAYQERLKAKKKEV